MLLRLVIPVWVLVLVASACGGTAAPSTITTTSIAAASETQAPGDTGGQPAGGTADSCDEIIRDAISVFDSLFTDLSALSPDDPEEREEEIAIAYEDRIDEVSSRFNASDCSERELCSQLDGIEPEGEVAQRVYALLYSDCVGLDVGCTGIADQMLSELSLAMEIAASGALDQATPEELDELIAEIENVLANFATECPEDRESLCAEAALAPVGEIAQRIFSVLDEFCGGLEPVEPQPDTEAAGLDACELLSPEEVAETAGVEIIGADHGPNIPGVVPGNQLCFYYPPDGFEVVTLKVITPNSSLIDPAPDNPQTYYDQNAIGEDVSGLASAICWC